MKNTPDKLYSFVMKNGDIHRAKEVYVITDHDKHLYYVINDKWYSISEVSFVCIEERK